MHLLIARHGLTDWNLSGQFQGQTDTPLNETGKTQAAALAKRLSTQPIETIYTSDLQRAFNTAQAVAKFHVCPIVKDARLRELNFGAWEGMTFVQIQQQYSDALSEWLEIPTHLAPPGGESLSQMAERVQSFVDGLLQNHKNQTILLVAHGGAIQVLLCLALGLSTASYWHFKISQASLSELHFYPQGAIINRLNDACHITKW